MKASKVAGLVPWEMKRLRQLEDENGELKKLVADLSLESRHAARCSAESYEACSAPALVDHARSTWQFRSAERVPSW
jgi:hypothetical protein